VGPAARRIAEEQGVALDQVQGTGPRGQVTKADVQRAAAQPKAAPAAPSAPAPGAPATSAPAPSAPAPTPRPPARTAGERGVREERVKMTRLRQRIAERLVEAQQTAAILTTFNEVDMSATMALRARYKDAFQQKYGVAVGFMSFFTKACIEALRAFPAVNAEIQGDEIVYKRYYDIGVAVGTERGLVVPVVRDADQRSFIEIELEIAELARKAREGKLSMDDLTGGTFSISNGGIYGSMLSTPILNPPQVGILGMHNIVKRAMVVGDEVAVRPMMYLALSYDHRIIDGREAVQFLLRVKECVEDPARLLLEI
jgi:2-oxoglutarate dehydrogenase E2 component (dihydrolipoamide succinyltransferase)